MGVGEASINNIMGGIENTGIRMHNHKKKLKQRFDIIKKLGQGTYGKVQLGINKETGQEVAIKTIKKSKIESEADLVRIRREIQIMSSVQHPNIIHIYEVFENREKMVLVMEYAAGGELYDYLSERKVLAEEEARRIFRQIATACYYCHKHKICHRDLKLENILLDENNNAKIADFGLSNVFDDTRLLSTFCGSPLYASPEIVRGTPYHGPEVDCWSLGVLLYTLVYGAMPFDGSNFKRLVKQISQGDYFEPQKPSPASPLIKEMLTVNPRNRANIEKICNHWWVNEGYEESCLDISEDLANQTPVRLDLLLSLAPPPPQLESEKLVVTGDASEEVVKAESMVPTRSQSVGSLMELTHPAERRIKDLLNDEKACPKRKLETTVSTDRANVNRKEKIIKENTVADITVHGTIAENASMEDASMAEALPLDKSATRTISKDMDVESVDETPDLSLEGAACAEILEDSAKKENNRKAIKVKRTPTVSKTTVLEGINEVPSTENVLSSPKADKENTTAAATKDVKKDEKAEPVKKKIVKKKVLSDKNENATPKTKAPAEEKEKKKVEDKAVEEAKEETAPTKPVERRRSKIFETAEKFQNMISSSESKTAVPEKPKKIVIPGVSVGGFKKEFERKASLTSTSPPKTKSPLAKKASQDEEQKSAEEKEGGKEESQVQEEVVAAEEEVEEEEEVVEKQPKGVVIAEDRKEKVKNAVNIISSALDKDGTRKSKSRPCMYRKPPVPFGASGRSASGSIGLLPTPLSPTGDGKRVFKLQVGPNDTRLARVEVSTPEHTRYITEPLKQEAENKTSSAEITLKSATLPRRKTTKAEIKLDYPVPKPATMEFKTEMAHRVEAAPKLATQRSEVTFPVSAPHSVDFRASSLEPDTRAKASPKERIIPISFEKTKENNTKESVQSPPVKPPTPRAFQTQKSSQSQRSESLSRQSTQESDSETTVSAGEPIRKSPREFIIPIAVEGGGYVTPRAGSLEPSETASTTSTMTNRSGSKFSRARRMNSLLSDRDGSEDESPFATLHRHSSFGRDTSDTEDSRRDAFHMHRLRSSRPRKATLEHNDSVSSGEEDDDDAFETLTAENLFSTLLSRVRNLTQQLNVEDGGRPGFPSSRLFSHFDHGTNFFNLHNRMDPLSRYSVLRRPASRENNTEKPTTVSGSFTTPWRRSVSRDLASDIDSVFRDGTNTATHTTTLPRGDNKSPVDDLNLSDLDLKKLKLSDEDALALSYLTPGLSKRIQQQLLAQLAPSEARKLSRTLSMRNRSEENTPTNDTTRNSVDRLSATLPRRFSVESPLPKIKEPRSFLPVKSKIREEFSPELDAKLGESYRRPSVARSVSLREPKIEFKARKSPESSLSSERSDYGYSYGDGATKRYTTDSLSPTRYSRYSPESSSSLTKYLSPNKYLDTPRSYTPSIIDTERAKSEIRQPSSAKRVSRFLRPDFFEPAKEDNVFLKEKKEREMETQKVLKEIRDKRIKNRINARRERSRSRDGRNGGEGEVETDAILKNVSDNIKNLESSVKGVHNYVNLPAVDVEKSALHNYVNVPALKIEEDETVAKGIPSYVNVPGPEATVVKKDRVSKLVRPKSYPVDGSLMAKDKTPTASPEKEVKVSKIGRLKKATTAAAKKDSPEKENKNKFLQSIEKKITKLRSLSSTPTTDDVDEKEKKAIIEKKSSVENAIKRLREQSLPRNLDHITESGLIKRAVSVEDLTTTDGNPKALQASRKSVTKILGLFKRYEERDKKKAEKVEKPKKSKANGEKNGATSLKPNSQQPEKVAKKKENVELKKPNSQQMERPKSLLLDHSKHFQRSYSGAKSDTTINDPTKPKPSRLPVNSFRRSLNLDNTSARDENLLNNNRSPEKQLDECNNRPDRRNLKLELTKATPAGVEECSNRNSLTTTDDNSSTFLSPCDDNDMSCDSWSVSSDYRQNELISPVSPNGYVYSGDESESVIDRIRRKSFYCRFNEKKRPRKSSYKDLELYKDLSGRKLNYSRTPADSAYLDYRNRNISSLNDGCNRYQTYNPRIHGRISSLYSDSEDANTLDDVATGKSMKYSTLTQPSAHARRSVSPSLVGEQYTPSMIPSIYTSNRSPTPHSPV